MNSFSSLPPQSINYFHLGIILAGIFIALLFLSLYTFPKINRTSLKRPFKILLKICLVIIVIIPVFIGGLLWSYWYWPPSDNSLNNYFPTQELEKVENIVTADEYYSGIEIDNKQDIAIHYDEESWAGYFIGYAKPSEEIIKIASNMISDKIGKEFFDKYIKYDSDSSMSGENVLSVHFNYTNLSRGIYYKTTTYPVNFYLDFNKELSVDKLGLQVINGLPDCHDLQRCNFISREEILQYIRLDMKKNGVENLSISLDELRFELDNSSNWPGPIWYFSYAIPQEKVPECKAGMGAIRGVGIDALTKQLINKLTGTTCVIPILPV